MRTNGITAAFLFSALCVSCRRDEGPCVTCPPPYVRSIELDSIDVGVMEAWLRVRFVDTLSARTFQLTRDGQILLTTQSSLAETTLVDTGLIPRGMFRYKAHRLFNGTPVDSSLEVQLTTMDRTSHNFTWQIDTLSDGISSFLCDVSILDENNIWAVGEIYERDSTGQIDPDSYNAAHWDGQRWEVMRILFQVCGTTSTASPTIYSVFAFGPDDIWFTEGGNFVHWDGTSFERICVSSEIVPGTLRKIWGRGVNDIYAVGNLGTIIHFNGVSWQPVGGGTTLDVYDIWGEWNPRTSDYEVYAVAAKQFVTFDKKIFRVSATGVTEVSDSGIPYSIHGIWFKPGRRYFIVGDGMYSKRSITTENAWQWLHPGVTPYYTYGVRGTNLNDVFVCGSFGEMLHFNGLTWQSFRTSTAIAQGAYNNLDVRGNLIVAVGYEYPRAVVARGMR